MSASGPLRTQYFKVTRTRESMKSLDGGPGTLTALGSLVFKGDINIYIRKKRVFFLFGPLARYPRGLIHFSFSHPWDSR